MEEIVLDIIKDLQAAIVILDGAGCTIAANVVRNRVQKYESTLRELRGQAEEKASPYAPKVKFVEVVFPDGDPWSRYEYKTHIELEPGDMVVVDSSFSGLSVAKVVGFLPESILAVKWVVDKIDLSLRKGREEI